MLRTALLIFAVLLMAAGGIASLLGCPLWGPVIGGAVLLVCVLFERWRYRKPPVTGASRWQATGERFIDPGSGEAVEVLYDPATGERRYVPAPDRDP